MAYRQNNSQGRNDRVRFDLMERIGVLSRKDNGWTREVNIVAWNDNPGKVDIREWDPDHKRMTRGVTLFEDEAEKLTKVLARRYGLRLSERETRTFAEQVNRSPVYSAPEETAGLYPEPSYDTAAAAVPAAEAAETFTEEPAETFTEEAAEVADGGAAAAGAPAML